VYDNNSLIQQLSRVSHFKRLPLKDIAAIVVSVGQVKRYPAGELVFHEGQPSAGLFVLLSGLIHLVKVGPQGRRRTGSRHLAYPGWIVHARGSGDVCRYPHHPGL